MEKVEGSIVSGREGFIWGAFLTLVVMFTVVFVVWAAVFKMGGIKAVECARPAMQVEATTARKGSIVERSIGECTFFSYNGPGLGGD